MPTTPLRTVKLDADGDIDVTNGRTSTVAGGDAALTIAKGKLETVRGEWFLGMETEGLPLWQHFLVNNPNPFAMENDVRARLAEVPGLTVTQVLLDVDAANPRELVIEWRGTFDGEDLEQFFTLT